MANTRRTTRTADQPPNPHEGIIASTQETVLPPPPDSQDQGTLQATTVVDPGTSIQRTSLASAVVHPSNPERIIQGTVPPFQVIPPTVPTFSAPRRMQVSTTVLPPPLRMVSLKDMSPRTNKGRCPSRLRTRREESETTPDPIPPMKKLQGRMLTPGEGGPERNLWAVRAPHLDSPFGSEFKLMKPRSKS